jgi:putative phage-type endonuclease
MIKHHDNLTQGTPEWFAARCGIITASECALILTPKGKIGNNDKTRAQIYELMAQRVSGRSEYFEPTWDMERGNMQEGEAIEYYEKNHAEVATTGFITNNQWGFTLGYSPDGLVGEEGLIEVKCPRQKAHMETLLTQTVPDKYMAQLQHGLLVTDRKWIDYVSFHAGLPLVVIRVLPDTEWQERIIQAATQTEEKISSLLKVYKQLESTMTPTEFIEEEEIV